MPHTLLVAIAHPDDESFPMGGTIAKYTASGARVVLVSATRGEAGIPGMSAEKTASLRETELRSAAQTLGVSRLEFLDYVDGEFDRANEDKVVAKLLKIFQRETPNVVITFGPDGISGHPDHVATHRFVTRVFERVNLSNSRLFYIAPSEATLQGCGVIPSKKMAGGSVASIDITNHRLSKVRAMQCHASQNPPNTGDPEKEIENLACHEYFTLARPLGDYPTATDLFQPLMEQKENNK